MHGFTLCMLMNAGKVSLMHHNSKMCCLQKTASDVSCAGLQNAVHWVICAACFVHWYGLTAELFSNRQSVHLFAAMAQAAPSPVN